MKSSASSVPDSAGSAAGPATGAWAPLRDGVFRALWFAQLGSNVGTWMQTVGAQWLLVEHTTSTTLVAAVQTASLLPVMLFSLPAGVLADVLDRRRLLLVVQLGMAVVAGVLAWLTAVGLTTPAVLLVLTFLLGCGQALTGPAWQAIQPELVPREQIPAAATLGSLTVNLARAVGPAVAGVLVAATGPAAVFAINAVSFLGVVAAVAMWHRRPQAGTARPERALAALHAGTRYVRNAPSVRRILIRSALFVVPGSALWALLPVVASSRLRLGAGGYGLLLGALGVGAVLGALYLSRLRTHLSANRLLVASALVFGGGTLILGVVSNVAVVTVVMVLTGVAWLVSLSTLNSALQLSLPAWVRARALAAYLLVFMGGQALGSLAWGALAGPFGSEPVLAAAAALLGATALSVRWLPLRALTGKLDRTTSAHWPTPNLVFEPEPDGGPVLVVKRYRVAEPDHAAFLEAMDLVGLSRRRTGATRWSTYRDGADADLFVEVFELPSWEEHLHQHESRLTGADAEFQQRADDLAEGEPTVEHLLPADTQD
ncbi:MFS transporter [Actinospica sp.]|uniref:MFS transporter n=1 Tax=Actinospica sp. TaxID=1872142 RepID=UPI0039C86A33